MTWLFSLYWLGAFAVAGPVLFHMWRRVPRGERSFSTLMFLAPSPPRITSRSRIEHWLLLLLRASVLLLIAFAFTRPLWRVPLTHAEDATDEQLLAILVDTSASMRRQDLWNDVVVRLDERIAKLPLETSVALYQFDHHFNPVVDFRELKSLEPSARRTLVRSRLKELKPTWQDTRLGEALVRTATALQDDQAGRGKPIKQQILLASDLQSGAEVVALQGYEWPDDISVELLPLMSISPSNAGLQVVERHAESSDDALRVRITNSSDSLKQQFALRWDHPESPETSVYVPSGQSRVLTPPTLPEGLSSTSLILRGDDHDFDNRVFLTETTPEKRLVIYCGHELANDAEGPRFFLERVFTASRQFHVELKEPHDANLASADSQPSLLILVQPDPEYQSLVRSHLQKGGTVLVASPTAEEMEKCLSLCGRDGITVSEAAVRNYAMLADIDFEHPLFAPFVESRFSNFTGIRFWKHRTLNGLAENSVASQDDQRTGHETFDRVLARFDDSEPAIVEIPVQRGSVILMTSGWHPADSQFARSSKFPMLMFRLLEQATGSTSRVGNQFVGDSLSWPTTPRSEAGLTSTGEVLLPDGKELKSLSVDQPFTQTDVPGIYRLSLQGRSEKIAVNLAADESRTAPMTLEQLESHGLKLKTRVRPEDIKSQVERERQLQLIELEHSQKLWQKVLMAVIVLLLAETVVSGFFRSSFAQNERTQVGSA